MTNEEILQAISAAESSYISDLESRCHGDATDTDRLAVFICTAGAMAAYGIRHYASKRANAVANLNKMVWDSLRAEL